MLIRLEWLEGNVRAEKKRRAAAWWLVFDGAEGSFAGLNANVPEA